MGRRKVIYKQENRPVRDGQIGTERCNKDGYIGDNLMKT